MTEIIAFFNWFFASLPNFLLSDPIKYFTGFFILGFAAKFIIDLVRGVNR